MLKMLRCLTITLSWMSLDVILGVIMIMMEGLHWWILEKICQESLLRNFFGPNTIAAWLKTVIILHKLLYFANFSVSSSL